MSVLLSFPGQGAQQAGMLQELQEHPLTQQVLADASVVLNEDVLLLDSAEALADSRAVQLCLLIAGVASARRLLDGAPQPAYTAGLSIGAYAAAVTCGALSFADALRLVSLRGRLMQEAYPQGYSMVAVQGLSIGEVEQLIEPYRQQDLPLYLANINADNQHALAGKTELLEQIEQQVQQQGNGRVTRIRISVPSHCELLQPQATQLAEKFASVQLQRPAIRYLSGSSARLLATPEQIKEDLIFNMCRVVNWQGVMESAFERGVRLHVQLAPGSVLTNLGRRAIPEAINTSYQGSNLETLQTLIKNQQ